MRKLLAAFMALIGYVAAFAQDINFSQFYELPLLRNPALAGAYTGDIRVCTGMRNQWSSVTTPYRTMALGTEMKFGLAESANYVSVGLQITSDVAGDSKLSKTQILPVLAFHKALNDERDSYLSLGFLGGPVQQRFDVSGLRFGDQFVNGAYSATNPTKQTFSNTNAIYWDASVGLCYSSTAGYDTRYYIGGALFHFTQPRVAFNMENDLRLNRKMEFTAGLSTPTGDEDRLLFYGDFFMQGGNNLLQLGGLYKHDLVQNEDDAMSFSFGGFYRWNDAIMPVVKLDYYRLGIGVTYDLNLSKLKPASQSRGGLEIMLSFRSFLNMRSSSYNRMRCPAAL